MGVRTVQHHEQARIPCWRWRTPSPQPHDTGQKPGSKGKIIQPWCIVGLPSFSSLGLRRALATNFLWKVLYLNVLLNWVTAFLSFPQNCRLPYHLSPKYNYFLVLSNTHHAVSYVDAHKCTCLHLNNTKVEEELAMKV